MANRPNKKDLAWPLFDAIVREAPEREINPWQSSGPSVSFTPDYDAVCRLLGVPLLLQADVRSGVPALALDVWVAYELRRAGLDPDWVWPRAKPPRVVSRDLLRFIESVPQKTRAELLERIQSGKTNNRTTGASAYLLGKNYTKQVDVVVSAWETGPEVLISTKRMDSSFGNNAANRIEESYGDAKNLRLRYPQAACGFLFGLRSTAWEQKSKPGEAGIADRLVDLLGKMGAEPDAYHATALLVPEYLGEAPKESPAPPLADATAGADDEEAVEEVEVQVDVGAELAKLSVVNLRHDLVPDNVNPGRFLKIMVETVLMNTPVDFHRAARKFRASPRTS